MENIERDPSTEIGRKRRRDEVEDDGENPKKQTVSARSHRPRRQREISGVEKVKLIKKMLEFERQDKIEKTSKDLIEADRKYLEKMLESKTSVLVLERSHTWRAHCRANFCIPKQLTKRPNIESNFRLKLFNLTNASVYAMPTYGLPGDYYHVSCMEQIFDLATLLQPKHLLIKGGATWVSLWADALQLSKFHSAVEDWFENGGRSYAPEEIEAWEKVYGEWKSGESSQWIRHCIHTHEGETCDCKPLSPEPKKSDYFPHESIPRSLSEVLASIREADQIDSIPQSLLDDLGAPSSDEEGGDLSSNKGKEVALRSLPNIVGNPEVLATPKDIKRESQ
ncbi:uncharacterized protein PAC_02228 [Phialocephala subalpina]|uniref:Uncharacterized protein n=1 Tax=Phialocephala subalpina TaxID=576137 RepID=A0A1L7WHW1_9HELO|nr:uncharacterized protein PAC_02228 [Phialocephala subalpina]